MFTEILKIKPQIDGADLSRAEATLSTRFGRIAKKFGAGIKTAIIGGGALAILNKILNPLKETNELIDKLLHRGDDLETNAEQFGTTSGKLFRLQQLAKTTGLDAEGLNQLMIKFQGAVVDQKKDMSKETAVKNFTDNPDMAEAFSNLFKRLGK